MFKSLFEWTSFKLGCNAHTTKIRFELIPDAGIYLFFEKGMRGGVSYISKRYRKANNNYLKYHDLKQESKYML